MKKDMDEEEKKDKGKSTNTAFILMFPTLILAGMVGIYTDQLGGILLAIALAIYQFLMLKKFIEDYYRIRTP